ncbi:MAG: hypothetical protein JW797_17625 [Bradymonadales bacterium]|nr:hypothetical protein [Bradymonadales bacterium]
MRRRTIGIRREDKSQWERRVPLTPEVVTELIEQEEIGVRVQASPNRIFNDEEFRQAGAEIAEDLSSCDVVMAVKEIPLHLFRKGGTYLFFSHTTKGQPYNMPMLRRLMEMGANLIDYERVVDDRDQRLIFFGRHAGLAGMIDTLWALGQRLDRMDMPTPLLDIQQAHTYPTLSEAENAIAAAGARLQSELLPEPLAPLICGFAGYGNVSQGAQHIFDLLPVEEVGTEDLATLTAYRNPPRDRLFKVVFHESHLVEPISPKTAFELWDYYAHPNNYRSVFERHLVHLTVLVNGIYWTETYPRLVTRDFLRRWFAGRGEPRLLVIGDISCDIGGSVECTLKSTPIDNPVFVYNPANGEIIDGFEGPGVVVLAVDILPAELPREASQFFAKTLQPFVAAIARADFTVPFEELELPPPIERALILYQGKLTPNYQYMAKYLTD